MRTGVYCPWSREKPEAVPHLDDRGIVYLAVGSPGDDFEKIAIRYDRRLWEIPELGPGHLSLLYRVVDTIDLDLKLNRMIFTGFFVFVRTHKIYLPLHDRFYKKRGRCQYSVKTIDSRSTCGSSLL